MSDPRIPLAAVVAAANRAIDGPFADATKRVEAIVLGHARPGPDGAPVLDAVGATMARYELHRLLFGTRDDLTAGIARGILAAESLAERQAWEAMD